MLARFNGLADCLFNGPKLLIISIFLYFSHGVFGSALVYVQSDHGNTYYAELALSKEEQAKGLMNRLYLLPWQAMLFVFPEPQQSTFWMKNTLIPLNIRFYDKDGQSLAQYPDALPCLTEPCTLYPSQGKALYVLETAAKYRLLPAPKSQLHILLVQ